MRVSIAVAARQDVPVYATGLGSVQASYTIGIHSQVEGIMQEVLFTEGQHVKKGDVLAKIDPRLYQAALDQAKAKRVQDAALLISAEKDLARSKTLVVQNVATQQLVDQQQARVDQLKGSVLADEAAIATAQTQLDYTQIKSPSDGRIGVRSVDPGNLVHASDVRPIATVVLTQPSAVMFTLPMQVLDDLREAMARGPVEVTAFDQNNRRQLSTGSCCSSTTSSTRRPRRCASRRCSPTRTSACGRANSSMRGRCSTSARTSSRCRARWCSAARRACSPGSSPTTYKAVARPIELGPVSGDLTVIVAGINEGDRVVTDGQYKLQVDAPVEIVGGPKTAENKPAENESARKTAESVR